MNITISFNINIGELGEAKQKKLTELFKLRFTIYAVPNQLIMTGVNEQVVILPVQIQYSCVQEDFSKIQSVISEIQNCLMLDPTINNITVEFSDVDDIGKKDTMTHSKEKFGGLISDSIGIGKREFFSYQDALSEIKIEPFVYDKTRMSIQGIYNIKTLQTPCLDSALTAAVDDYKHKHAEILEKLQ